MDSLENDLEILENAMRVFFQIMKRPQNWSRITSRSGVTIDRPSAIILKLMLDQSAPCHVQGLADHLGIEAPFITRKTQALEQAGYLRRTPGRTDRRAVDLRLTGRGRSITKRLWDAQREIIAEALKDWQPLERQQFVQLFERFSNDLAIVSSSQHTSKPERTAHV
jgi:DNA-binding MarR family transcriptional regulator